MVGVHVMIPSKCFLFFPVGQSVSDISYSFVESELVCSETMKNLTCQHEKHENGKLDGKCLAIIEKKIR